MKRIDELNAELRKLDEKLAAFLKKAEDGGVTPEEVTEAEGLSQEVDEMRKEKTVLEKAAGIRVDLKQPTDTPAGLEDPATGEQRGFDSFGEYLQAIARVAKPRGDFIAGKPTGIIDKRLVYQDAELRSTGMEESTPSLGGFLVHTDVSNEIFKKAHQQSLIFNRVRQVTISSNSNSFRMPTIDETSRADGSRGGGTLAYWLGEGGTKTASNPKFGTIEISLNKLIGLSYATDELLEDASALGQIVSQGFADEFSFQYDDAILNGTGAGQPLGILNAAALVEVAKETGQAATTINWENIKAMYARLHAGSRNNMLWLANQDCLPQLMSMTQAVGTGGQTVWLPANGAFGLSHDTLMGRPILYPEQCQTLGTAGDIYLIDPTQYLMITKGGMQSATSIHVKFTTDETTFRFVMRLGGQPMWNAALTPYKGSGNTQSPFIDLAVRE